VRTSQTGLSPSWSFVVPMRVITGAAVMEMLVWGSIEGGLDRSVGK